VRGVKASVKPGREFGKWTVIREVEKRGKNRYVLCRCACGREKPVMVQTLASGDSTRCRSCSNRKIAFRHGQASQIQPTPTYRSWLAMRRRCHSPRATSYDRYGGRGIRVCDRWDDFNNFLADMGERPSAEHTIDRLDCDGDYQPGNCRWATPIQQGNNRRCNRVLTLGERSQTLAQWAQELGIDERTISERLKRWTVEEALTIPLKPNVSGQPRSLRPARA